MVALVALAAVLFTNGSSWGSAGEVHARIVPAMTAPIAAGREKVVFIIFNLRKNK